MRRQAIAVVCAAAVLAGCGGGDSGSSGGGTLGGPQESPLSRYIGKLPIGYRFAPSALPEGERAFREKLAHDFDTRPDAIEIRNVYLGAQFKAGIVVLRAGRPFTVAEIADKETPGHLAVRPVTIAGKKAHLIIGVGSAGDSQLEIVDTDGRVILIVGAERYPVLRQIAARIVR
jgi:ABC-type glycerol-3-phosphate transport system substrate-binding protein